MGIDLYEDIVGRIATHVNDMHAAGRTLTSDVVQLARYLDITLPPGVDTPPRNVAVSPVPPGGVDNVLPEQAPAPAPENENDELSL